MYTDRVRAHHLTFALALTACASAAPEPSLPSAPPAPPAPASAPPATLAAPAAPALPQRFAEPGASFAFADPERVAKLRTAFTAIDTIGADQLSKQKLPGLTIGVVVDGELLYAKGFGYANVASAKAPDADTIYRIGSITKSFTGLVLLSLRDEGALALDDSLAHWLPEASGLVYPTLDSRPITLRQLLTHTSGLPRSGSFPQETGPSEDDVTRSLAGFALASPPGTQWSYSNVGFSLLAIAAARAAHTPYRDLVKKRLLDPLGMTSTGWDAADLPTDRLAIGYAGKDGGSPKVAEPWKLGAAEGAGGLYASTRDMARYLAFQLAAYPPRGGADPGPIARSTVREAHSTGVASGLWVRLEPDAQKGEKAVDAITETYGFGWVAAKTCEFDPLVWHNGGIDGFRSDVRFLPKQGVGVITLVNANEADTEAIAMKVMDALRKTGGLTPRTAVLAPSFAPAIDKLMAVIHAWDEATYTAMLTKGRRAIPEEQKELAGYRERHGTCTGWKPIEIFDPTHARLSLACSKGPLEMEVDLGPDGLISGFSGTSRDVPIPPEERKVADALAKLIGNWSDALYKKHLSKAFPKRDEVSDFYSGLRKKYGRCQVRSAEHVVFDRTILLSCERGRDLRLTLTVDEKDHDVVRSYKIRPTPSEGTCPVR